MRAARELCNISQLEAAARLGYANSSKLAKVENASDTESVPLVTIERAALLYDVSIDYLFGIEEDWEPGLRRETQSWLIRSWEVARRRDLEALEGLGRRVSFVTKSIESLVVGARDVAAALKSVQDRCDDFDTIPAGAKLLAAIERQADAAIVAECGLRKFRSEIAGETP